VRARARSTEGALAAQGLEGVRGRVGLGDAVHVVSVVLCGPSFNSELKKQRVVCRVCVCVCVCVACTDGVVELQVLRHGVRPQRHPACGKREAVSHRTHASPHAEESTRTGSCGC